MKKILLLISLFHLIAWTTLAQNYVEMGSQIVTNYTPKEYGAYGQNWDIAQGTNGIMYFGNWGGLLEYDGAFWDLHQLPNKSSVNSLAIAADGKIFIGGISELGYFLPDDLGKQTFHSLLTSLPEESRDFTNVWQTFIIDDKVYFLTYKSIFIWNDQDKTFITLPNTNGYHVMFQVKNKVYVREYETGINMISDDSLILLKGSQQFADEKVFVMLPFPGEENTSLLVTRTMGMFKYDGSDFLPFKTEADEFITENLIYGNGTSLSDGNILLGTLSGGSVIIDQVGREVRRYNMENGIINNNIYSTFQDNSGAIWLATDNGISRIDYASPIIYFDSRNNFQTVPLNITRFRGTIYVATTTGAYYLEPTTSDLHSLNITDMQGWNFLKTENELLLGTNGGLFEINGDRTIQLKNKAGGEYRISAMKCSNLNPDRIILGTDVGVFMKSKIGDRWDDETKILENDDQKTSIIEDYDGGIWVGTVSSGIFRITFKKDDSGNSIFINPEVENYGKESGLQRGQVSVDKIDGENYFFTLDSIYKFDVSNRLFYSDISDTLIANFYRISQGRSIIYFDQDEKQRLWIATKGNLSMGVLQPDNSYEWISAPFQRFAEDEIYNIYQDENDLTWISTNAGIIKFDFKKLDSSKSDFSTYIRNVSIGNDSIIYFGGGVKLPKIPEITFSDNSIKFSYAATSYEGKSVNKYKIYLDGFDKDWSSWTNQTSKEYTNLPPGHYTFKVKGLNILGIVGNEGTYSFEILPPWYRTWWAYLVYLLVFCSFIFIADRIRRNYLLKKERERAEFREAKLRAKAVELENKALQAENESKLLELEHAKTIEKAYKDLKSTQAQLIQSEKMASLGELTAGIAHEIQNPLNFVNNFSEVSAELVDEMNEELEKGDIEEAKFIGKDLKENLSKITLHGKRADAIVKGMLEHSRTNKGEKALTDLNALVDEFVRLSYHGLRAKDKSFNADFKLELDPDLPKVNVVASDIGRVILNLVNNAFYAVDEKAKSDSAPQGYEPEVIFSSKKTENGIELSVKDNGGGIPEQVRDKIFQPFFTTKPTGSGTGLGLSLSYDIVKAHGGELRVESIEGEGSELNIQLPLV